MSSPLEHVSNVPRPGSAGDGGAGGQTHPAGIGAAPDRRRLKARLVLGALIVAALAWLVLGSSDAVIIVALSCAVYALAALGQELLIGRAGQVALSGAAFLAVGAFLTGIMAPKGWAPFPVPLIASAAAGWLIGLVTGITGLRFRGLYLLALQQVVVFATEQYESAHAPGGLVVPTLSVAGYEFSDSRHLLVLFIVFDLLACAGLIALYRSRVGLAWRAVKESEVAAAIAGIDVIRWKLYAFAASSALTAIAGSLLAYATTLVDSQTFTIALSINLIVMVYLGGAGSVVGPMVGAILLTATPFLLQTWIQPLLGGESGQAQLWFSQHLGSITNGIFLLAFLVILLVEPGGLAALTRRAGARFERLANRRSATS